MKTSKRSNSDGSTPIKVNPQQEQQWSEQRPGYMPLDPSLTKLSVSNAENRKVGYMVRGARKTLKNWGYPEQKPGK